MQNIYTNVFFFNQSFNEAIFLKENSSAKLSFGLIKHLSQPFSEICFHDNRMQRVLSLKTV